MNNKIFLGIDIQNDFAIKSAFTQRGVAQGSLYVPPPKEGQDIPEMINKYLGDTAYDFHIFTKDDHPKGHISFASTHGAKLFDYKEDIKQMMWPDHCVQGTWGNQICDAIERQYINVIFNKGQQKHVDSYSGIKDNDGNYPTGLEYFLSAEPCEVFIAGYCFDFCVRYTAIDCVPFAKLGVYVIKELCPSVYPEHDKETTEVLIKAGVKVI